jgi:hypothetical protein
MQPIRVILFSVFPLLMAEVAFAQPLPADVRAFANKREACDHWRGEDGYDDQRALQINRAVCETCRGTDAELKRLKKKHSSNQAAMKLLDGFDPEIEPKDKKKAREFCDQAKRGVVPKREQAGSLGPTAAGLSAA